MLTLVYLTQEQNASIERRTPIASKERRTPTAKIWVLAS